MGAGNFIQKNIWMLMMVQNNKRDEYVLASTKLIRKAPILNEFYFSQRKIRNTQLI
jgi:hypothetical protein